jgi:putative ABC transport system permease protein
MKPLLSLRIILRSILKNKIQSLVSILGLGIGLGCVLLIILLYLHENSFDQFIPEKDQVYRIIHGDNSQTPFPLGETAADEIPSIDNFFRYFQNNEFEIKNSNNEIVKEKQFACADPSVFTMLGIDMIIGRPMESINEVTISEQMARKYFNTNNAVNQTINARFNDEFRKLTVCGVFKDFPSNASISPNFISHTDLILEFLGNRKRLLGEYGSALESFKSNWNRGVCITYIKINSQTNASQVTNQIQKYSDRFEEQQQKEKAFSLQPVTDVYLRSDNISDVFTKRGNANELKYYAAIALFILLIAVFNYIFLTKVKMDIRLKEIGTKRALGAQASTIRKQLLFESNIISFMSLLPASLVIFLGIPFINSTLGRTLDTNVFSIWYVIPLLLFIPLLTGSISGLVVGTRFFKVSPAMLLNKKLIRHPTKQQWKNSFLSLHFLVFILLIVGVVTLKKQINYGLTNFTAINPENVMVCELNTAELSQKFDVINDQISQYSGVIKCAGSSFVPPFNWTLPIRLKNPETNESIVFDGLIMGKGMTELLDMEMIEGEHFGDFNGSEPGFIFNESAALKYQLKVGEIFNGFRIRGIVKDFTAHTLRELIKPMVIIQQHPQKMRLFVVKTSGENDEQIMAKISTLFKEISPDKVVEVYTLKEQINQFYTREQNQAKLISAFSFLAIVLAVMGLLGMVMNTASRKTKEIGIRKVNGAKVSEILTMLNMEFIKWVAIAFIIATPLAYYVMYKWLENFAYKTELSWWIFALAGLLALGIALLTVSWQSWRAATRNPVEALRYE